MTPLSRRRVRTAAPQARRCVLRRGERGAASVIEFMALAPMCALIVLTIAWAGRTAQAELAVSLAAQEAAVAAAVCCGHHTSPEQTAKNGAGGIDAGTARELAAEAVIASRPSLERLCAGGPRPARADGRWTTHTAADIAGPRAAGAAASTSVRLVTAHVACTADGAIAPTRGLFPARTVHGHGTHLAVTTATIPTPPGTPEPTP
ncbi:hypothetical protein [Candidatus Poriferisodalis sp.]|uniref:hypothetical protein n=1 Tax=Candidatus Poriferisodalis sp. TaxID=3101277 RepID=UPI003B01735E